MNESNRRPEYVSLGQEESEYFNYLLKRFGKSHFAIEDINENYDPRLLQELVKLSFVEQIEGSKAYKIADYWLQKDK